MNTFIKLVSATTGSLLYIHTASSKSKANWDYNWDQLAPESLLKPNASDNEKLKKMPVVTRRVYLIRHGQYESSKSLDSERILTKLGRTQAKITGQYLSSLDVKFDRIVCSTMTRAKETCAILKDNLITPPKLTATEYSDLLREGHPVDADPYNRFKPPNWEFTDGCRIEAAFRTFCHRASYNSTEDEHEVIVCHANVIRYFICRALQNNPEAWLRISLANGSITELVFEADGRVFARAIGDKAHMEHDLVTFS